jgi:hypothetical protein
MKVIIYNLDKKNLNNIKEHVSNNFTLEIVGIAYNKNDVIRLINLYNPEILITGLDLNYDLSFYNSIPNSIRPSIILFNNCPDCHNCFIESIKEIMNTRLFCINNFNIDNFKSIVNEIIFNDIESKHIEQKNILLVFKNKLEIIKINDIIRIEAKGNYSQIFMIDREYPILYNKCIVDFKNELQDDFIRTHKSHLINKRYIKKSINNNSILILNDGTEISVSRRKKTEIIDLI